MAKKTGANKTEQARICELSQDNYTAEEISDLLQIVVESVISFLCEPADPTMDLDRDGKPDVVVAQQGDVTVTVDEDSINIDADDDGEMDIHLHP